MTTSIIVYLPTKRRKAVSIVIDTEHQLAMRAIRKGTEQPIFGKWRNCRCDPGVWELKVTPHFQLELTAPRRRVSLEELWADETIDQNVLNTIFPISLNEENTR